MSAYGTHFPYCATPKGLVNTVGAAHTAFATRQVQGKPPAPLPQKFVAQPVKAAATRLLRKP